MSRFLEVYVTPATVFAAVIMGGGYGTGREVVEFFSRHGTFGGLLGILSAVVLMAVVLIATFDTARMNGSYEYREFFGDLLGRYWWTFEVLYLALFLLVLGVLSSASGSILQSEYGIPSGLGLTLILFVVALLVFFGRSVLERILTFWTATMYAVFLLYFFFVLSQLSHLDDVVALPVSETGSWLKGGSQYVLYNVAIAPVLLFATRGVRSSRDAVGAGITTAVLVMLPAALFHISFALGGAQVLDQPVPVYWMIERFAPEWFRPLFVLALVGTLAQTGAGLIHGFIERVDHAVFPATDEALGYVSRLTIAALALGSSWLFAQIGIIELIASGYSALAVGFAIVYVIPLMYRYLRKCYSDLTINS